MREQNFPGMYTRSSDAEQGARDPSEKKTVNRTGEDRESRIYASITLQLVKQDHLPCYLDLECIRLRDLFVQVASPYTTGTKEDLRLGSLSSRWLSRAR